MTIASTSSTRRSLFIEEKSCPAFKTPTTSPKSPSETDLQRVKKAMKDKNSGVSLLSTSLGSSGYTLIASSPQAHMMEGTDMKTEIRENSEEKPVKFILKWVLERSARDEVVCNQIGEAFGLHAPAVQEVSRQTSKLFESPTKDLKSSFSPDPFQLLSMSCLEGRNLSEFCASLDIFKLETTALNAMMAEFGKGAIFDFLIGNTDRFFRFHKNEQDVFELDSQPIANPGNVLIHTTPVKGKNLACVGFIDNTNPILPVAKVKQASSGISFDGFASFFNSHSPATNRSYKEPSSPKVAEQSKRTNIIPDLNRLFEQMIQGAIEKPEIIESHLICSIKNCISRSLIQEAHLSPQDTRTKSLMQQIENSLPAVLTGLNMGLKQLFSPSFQEEVVQLSTRCSEELQQLLTLNLLSLQKIGKSHA